MLEHKWYLQQSSPEGRGHILSSSSVFQLLSVNLIKQKPLSSLKPLRQTIADYFNARTCLTFPNNEFLNWPGKHNLGDLRLPLHYTYYDKILGVNQEFARSCVVETNYSLIIATVLQTGWRVRVKKNHLFQLTSSWKKKKTSLLTTQWMEAPLKTLSL